jgi:two-component system OmpR family sensor kinase
LKRPRVTSLKLRLVIGVLVLAAFGLFGFGVAVYSIMDGYLQGQVQSNLTSTSEYVMMVMSQEGPAATSGLLQPEMVDSGDYFEEITTAGQPLPGVTWPSGQMNQADPPPVFTPAYLARIVLGANGTATGPFRVTVPAAGGAFYYRAQLEPLGNDRILVVAAPLQAVDQTLHRLALIEELLGAVVLLVLAGLSIVLMRVGLRPLEDITMAAGQIAGGDLTRRVDRIEGKGEVARLSQAFNSMLGHIESAMNERQLAEDRLRRFLADASHELRTPLTAIKGYSELIRRGAFPSDDELRAAFARIEGESDRMCRLVRDMLELARLDQDPAIEFGPVALGPLLEDAAADSRAVDSSRSVSLSVPPDDVVVLGDEARIRQIVANLVSNARSHTPPGSLIHLTCAVEGTVGRLVVGDNGPGLDRAQAKKVFERFYRADPARSGVGSGLGLPITQSLVEAHKGTIRLETAPGRGARFVVDLPLFVDQPVRTSPLRRPDSDPVASQVGFGVRDPELAVVENRGR